MYKYLLLPVFLLIGPFSITAQAPADQPETRENSLLWEISGNGLEQPSYLYGTIHMIAREDFFLTDETIAALDACEQITFEIDLEEMTGLFSQISLMMQMFMDDGVRISDLLPEADYQLVEAHFDAMGMPFFMLDRIKPLFLSMMAETDFSAMGQMQDDMVSYEFELADLAAERDMRTGGLETAEYQISLFDSIPYQVQAEMLLDAVKAASEEADSTDTVNEMDMLTELYKAEDIESMQDSFSDEDSEYAPYEALLLTNRNRNWIPVMANMMERQPTFFAVGAGHLGGDEGVISLLRAEGYKLRPLHHPNEKP